MKPRVAIFEFGCCEGCQLQIVNLEEKLLDLLDLVDVVVWREARSEHAEGPYDISFVEGSITRDEEMERLRWIRENSKILVALGACAHIGGINCLKNFMDQDEVRRYVYGDKADWFPSIPARPLSAVVPVDYAVPGCPIDKEEFLEVVKALALGKTPPIPNYPVCVECKMAENVCVFNKGMVCLGPVTRAGCNARCPSNGNKCIGCRGLIDDPNVNSHKEVLAEHGLTVEDILGQFRLFDGYSEVAK
ncbi:MAG: NADH:ubiquinone oxidoreductase [Chloroflexi bacterium]|nr:MAG: NADH:ubiquinone oxidoreductase [Chloroflexota bacterium]HDN79277.1 NADH:ubiquinone oxidoreductase [Chloroflexota bacterium]